MARRIFSFMGICLWLAGQFVLLPTELNAQATNGVISGTVTDPSGAAVPGATVQVKNVSTGVIRTVTTNELGRYRVPDLLVGQYEVQASQGGFRTVVDIDLNGTFNTSRAAFEALQHSGDAMILNISATLHYHGTPLQLHASAEMMYSIATGRAAVEKLAGQPLWELLATDDELGDWLKLAVEFNPKAKASKRKSGRKLLAPSRARSRKRSHRRSG